MYIYIYTCVYTYNYIYIYIYIYIQLYNVCTCQNSYRQYFDFELYGRDQESREKASQDYPAAHDRTGRGRPVVALETTSFLKIKRYLEFHV